MYHAVDDKPLPHVLHLYRFKTASEFEADILYLKSEYCLPTWEEFVRHKGKHGVSRRPAAILTFDDGLSQCFDRVRPLLLKHQVPCIFFITRDFVDNARWFYRHKVSLCIEKLVRANEQEQSKSLTRLGESFGIGEFSLAGFVNWTQGLERPDESSINQACKVLGIELSVELTRLRPNMSREQVQQLAREGFTIGGHSLSHTNPKLIGKFQLEKEIVESCDFVQQLVGSQNVPFAFPFAATDTDRQHLRSILGNYPCIQFCFGTGGMAMDAPFIINRIASDEPAGLPGGRSGLKKLIQFAYSVG